MTAPGEVGDPRIQVPIETGPGGQITNASVPMATSVNIGDPVAIIPTGEFAIRFAAAPLRVPEVGEAVVLSRIRNDSGGIKFVGIPTANAAAPVPDPILFSVSQTGEAIVGIHISKAIPDWIAIGYSGHDVISTNGGRYTYLDRSYYFMSRHEYFLEYGGAVYTYQPGSLIHHQWYPETNIFLDGGISHNNAYPTVLFSHPSGGVFLGGAFLDTIDNSGNFVNEYDMQRVLGPADPSIPLQNIVTNPFLDHFQTPGLGGLVWRWQILDASSLVKCRVTATPTRMVYHYINQVNSEIVSSRATDSHDLTATGGIDELQWCGNETVVGTNGTNRVYVSQNGFVTYTTFESPDASHLTKIGTWQTGEVWIIDSVDPVALRSANYGRTWERIDLPAGIGHYTAVAVDPYGNFVLLGTDTGAIVRFNYNDPAWLAPLPLQESGITTTKSVNPSATGFAVAGGYSGTTFPQADITLSYTGNEYWPSGSATVTFGGTFADTVGEVIGIRGTLSAQDYGSSWGGILSWPWGYTLTVSGATVLTQSFTTPNHPTGSSKFEVIFTTPVTDPAVTMTLTMGPSYNLYIPKNSGVTLALDAEWIR